MIERFDDAQIRLIRQLQEEFPLCERPFQVIAARAGITEAEAVALTARLQREGALRRIAATLHHTRAGFAVNTLLAWDVPEDRLDAAAKAASALQQVTHCYARRRDPEFDYNLYTMVHEKDEPALEALVRELKALIQPVKFCSLRTTRELKKTGMKYFSEQA